MATVDADGLASGLDVGQALITAHAEGASSHPVLLTVVTDPAGVARVVVTPDTLRLPAGSTQTFTAAAFNLNGDRLEGKDFTWASSNPQVAAIDAAGTTLALEPGVTDITATTEGISSASAYLVVPGASRQGTFVKRAGSSYLVAGTATLEELPGGGLRLTFSSDFTVTDGPGLGVFLSNSSTVGSGSLNLGDLQKSSGEQTYFISADASVSLVLTGTGDVLEPEDGMIGIGSGGPYALAAARALIERDDMSAEEIARKAMDIAAGICVYTNESIVIESITAE